MAKRGKMQTHYAIGQVGWMPFWWGNKFNKRLAAKRKRQYDKRRSGDE